MWLETLICFSAESLIPMAPGLLMFSMLMLMMITFLIFNNNIYSQLDIKTCTQHKNIKLLTHFIWWEYRKRFSWFSKITHTPKKCLLSNMKIELQKQFKGNFSFSWKLFVQKERWDEIYLERQFIHSFYILQNVPPTLLQPPSSLLYILLLYLFI